jgi:hypothetical protein
MAIVIPVYAKSLNEALKDRRPRPATAVTTPARATTPALKAAPARRRFGRLFRRDTPTAFHRCLAVHMHFAQRASALD